MSVRPPPPLYGLLAEFRNEDALRAAAHAAREHGYTRAEAYSPFPIEGLEEVVGLERNWVAPICLLGGILGGAGTYFLQYYSAVINYPINVGGRPLNSWPSFIPPTFELTILGAAIAALVTMLVQSGLPRLHHPLFDVEEFESASRNRFFLCLPAADPVFAPGPARELLESLDPMLLREVPA
jgi:hypothetical protein